MQFDADCIDFLFFLIFMTLTIFNVAFLMCSILLPGMCLFLLFFFKLHYSYCFDLVMM